MAVYETHTDSEALVSGTHQGSSGASRLYYKDYDFRMYGVVEGAAIHNDTQGTDGIVTVVGNEYITDDANTWNNGDAFSIYKTATKNGFISRIATDRSRGWKVTMPSELDPVTEWFPRDVDDDYQYRHLSGSPTSITTTPVSDDGVYFNDTDDVWWWTGFSKES